MTEGRKKSVPLRVTCYAINKETNALGTARSTLNHPITQNCPATPPLRSWSYVIGVATNHDFSHRLGSNG